MSYKKSVFQENRKNKIIEKCKELNFNWLNKDDWIYTNWEDNTLFVEFKRDSWPIKSRINININVLFKTHGTKGLYFRENEVRDLIIWFCDHNDLSWENKDTWTFKYRTDKNIMIKCNKCGFSETVSFRVILERLSGCTNCLRNSKSLTKETLNNKLDLIENLIPDLICLDKDKSYESQVKTKFTFSYIIYDDNNNETPVLWESSMSNISNLIRKSLDTKTQIDLQKSKNFKITKENLIKRLKFFEIEYDLGYRLKKGKEIFGIMDKMEMRANETLFRVSIYYLIHFHCLDSLIYSQKISLLELGTQRKLNSLEIENVQQKTFPWLKYRSNLHIDFYLPEYNLGIECQGYQHFFPVKYFGGDEIFQKIQIRDDLKWKLCNEHNIKIVYYLDKTTYNKIIRENLNFKEKIIIVGEKELEDFLKSLSSEENRGR